MARKCILVLQKKKKKLMDLCNVYVSCFALNHTRKNVGTPFYLYRSEQSLKVVDRLSEGGERRLAGCFFFIGKAVILHCDTVLKL